MELKLAQVVSGYSALQRIGAEKLPIKVAYTIQRNLRMLEQEAKHFDEQRIELAKKYGTLTAAGDQYTFTGDQQKEFSKELTELLDVIVGLDLRTIALDDFTAVIAPMDLVQVDWMFVDELELKVTKGTKETNAENP
jgi:hypothetical protein